MSLPGTTSAARVLFRYVGLPLAAPAAIVALYLTPVGLFGCANRGLLALAVAFLSTGSACVTTVIGARALRRRDPAATRWFLSTLILLLPIALLAGPLG